MVVTHHRRPTLQLRLKTPRLHLRSWRSSDAPALRAALDASDEHLRPWIPFMAHEPRTLEQTRAWIEGFAAEPTATRLAVWIRSSGALVGEVLFIDRAGPGALELGYWLHHAHVGHGYATEATAALVRHVFAEHPVQRLEFHCDPQNHRSSALAQKLGARVTGTETVVDDGQEKVLEVWTLHRPQVGLE